MAILTRIEARGRALSIADLYGSPVKVPTGPTRMVAVGLTAPNKQPLIFLPEEDIDLYLEMASRMRTSSIIDLESLRDQIIISQGRQEVCHHESHYLCYGGILVNALKPIPQSVWRNTRIGTHH